MFRSSHFSLLVFGHFWRRSYENTKILRNLCLHFARQNGQGGKTQGKNHATKVTKIPKTKRRKYGMNKTRVAERYKDPQLTCFTWTDWTKTVCSVLLNTGKTLLCFERFQDFLGNVLPVLNITKQTVLVQTVYVKRSAGDLYTFPIATIRKCQLSQLHTGKSFAI